MSSSVRDKVTPYGERLVRELGLRLARHRKFCWKCRALTRHGVGGGLTKPVCLERAHP